MGHVRILFAGGRFDRSVGRFRRIQIPPTGRRGWKNDDVRGGGVIVTLSVSFAGSAVDVAAYCEVTKFCGGVAMAVKVGACFEARYNEISF